MTRCRRLTTDPARLLPRRVTTALVATLLSVVSAASAQEAGEAPPAGEPAEAPAEAPPAAEAPAQAEPPAGEATAPAPEEVAPPEALPEAPPAEEVPAPPPAEKKAAPAAAAVEATAEPEIVLETEDKLTNPNYTPGYRRTMGFGMPPYVPRTGTQPGGTMQPYGVPVEGKEWTFKWTGYMQASLAYSIDHRRVPAEGQSETVFHTPPATVEDWRAFTNTNSIPGNWIGMKFSYGNDKVTAVVSIDTWNPTRPTTYYQLGSQGFINDTYLLYRPDPLGPFRVQATVGYFAVDYGMLGQYGNGLYPMSIAGGARGTGESLVVEYDLNDDWVGTVEHGVMGGRTGKAPDDIVAQESNSWANPALPAWWFQHGHVGVIKKGDPEIQIQAHWLTSWSQDDTAGIEIDQPDTRDLDESNVPDGRMTTYALSLRLKDSIYGFFGVGASITEARNSTVLRGGMVTYGGDGEQLQDMWLGEDTGGTGTLYVAGINHQVSLGKVVAYPTPFPGDGPDLVLTAGAHVATTKTEFEGFDGRLRLKYGVDSLYTFLPWLGVGVRGDMVIPRADDSRETFYVFAPRIQFKSDWTSRENLTLNYVKWFYGERTRNEGTGLRTPDRLDDQMIALSYNMWW